MKWSVVYLDHIRCKEPGCEIGDYSGVHSTTESKAAALRVLEKAKGRWPCTVFMLIKHED